MKCQYQYQGWEAGHGAVVALSQYERLIWTGRQIWPVPSSLLGGGPADGWALISSRQTCHRKHLPHHVYGNQHFSRDLLIATEGEGGGGLKTIGLPLVFCKENQQIVLFTDQNLIYRPAAKWHPWTMQWSTVHSPAWLPLESIAKNIILRICDLLIFPLHSE